MIWVSPTWPKTMRLMSKIGGAGKGEWWPRARVLSSHQWVIKYSRRGTKYNTTQIQTHYKCDQILGRPNTGRQEPTSTLLTQESWRWGKRYHPLPRCPYCCVGSKYIKVVSIAHFPHRLNVSGSEFIAAYIGLVYWHFKAHNRLQLFTNLNLNATPKLEINKRLYIASSPAWCQGNIHRIIVFKYFTGDF